MDFLAIVQNLKKSIFLSRRDPPLDLPLIVFLFVQGEGETTEGGRVVIAKFLYFRSRKVVVG